MARKMGSSKILIEFIEGDSMQFPGLEAEQIYYCGESAFWEGYDGMLLDSLKGALNDPVTEPGWYLFEDFVCSVDKDYFGEVDCDFEVGNVRKIEDDEDLDLIIDEIEVAYAKENWQ